MIHRHRRKHKNPRSQTSCIFCHQRKVKCNANKPCDQCMKRGQAGQCVYKVPRAPEDPNLGEVEQPTSYDEASQPPSHQSETTPSLPSTSGVTASTEDCHRTSEGTGRFEPTLPTHVWTREENLRGRSHSSWALNLFKPLTVLLDDANPQSTWRKDNISLLDIVYDQWRRNKLQARDSVASAKLSDELPPADIIRLLVERYFETFHTIFPVLDQAGFTKDLENLLRNLSNAPFYILVQVMLVLALANGTYPPSQAPIPQSRAFVWLDLASSVPTTALELDECSIDTLRVIALLNTAKQALKWNETADYVYSGAGVRFSMMLGLNRMDVVDKELTQIWDTVRELDLHACMACGAAPTVSPDRVEDVPKSMWADQGNILTHESYVNTEALLDILNRSRATRTKIITIVNTEQQLQSQDVMHLSRKLSDDMAPISNNVNVPAQQQSFTYKYVLFVYQKFLATLHRPFAPFRDPAFYLSRDITRNQAQDHYRQVCAAFRGGRNEDPFSALIAGNGTMFRIQAIQSALWLSFELYREDDYDMYVPGISGSGAADKATIEALLSEGIVFAEKAIRTHELAGAAFLVPSLVLHHRAAIQRGELPGSQQYHDMMIDASKRLKDQLTDILA